MSEIIANNFSETQKFGAEFSAQIREGGILCLEGELGAGKTTFTQGLLKGLGCEGPFTSPTFVLMKKYEENIYHLDAYRIDETNLDDLGWDELIADKKNIIIVEWPERIQKRIPGRARWMHFEWIDENKRKIDFKE